MQCEGAANLLLACGVNSSLILECLRYKYGSWPCRNLKRLKTKYTSLSNEIENKNHFCLKATST